MNIDIKKKREKRNCIFRWIIYYLVLIIEYVFMTTFQINIPLPMLLVSTALCISMFEDPYYSAVTGCAAGLMLDAAEGTLIGMNGIILMWCCLMSSLLFYFVVRKHIFNIILIVTAAAFVQTGFRYIFYYSIWGYEKNGRIYLSEFLPVIISTVISVLIVYPFIKMLCKKLGEIKDTYIEEKSDDIVRE